MIDSPPGSPQSRAQSTTIGFVLIIGLIIVSTTVIIVIGGSAVTSAQDEASLDQVQKVMTELDSRGALVALGGSEQQQIDLPDSKNSRYQIQVDDPSTAEIEGGWMTVQTGTGTKIMNKQPLGKLVYTVEGKTIAYQGGGVWYGQDGGSRMVSPPEFHYRGKTLTLPLVTFAQSSDRSVSGRVYLSKASTEQITSAASNPLSASTIEVIVKSEYWYAWGEYFKDRTDGDVKYLSGNRVKLKLTVPPSSPPPVSGGLISGAASSTLELKSGASVDSYDSSLGDYASTNSDDTKIVTAGDVRMKSNSKIYGSAVVGGDIEFFSGSTITGDLNYGGTVTKGAPASDHVDGTVSNTASVTSPDPVDDLINKMRNRYSGASNNDNDDHQAVIDALEDSSVSCPSPCELTAGNYFLSDLHLSKSETLTLNTEAGDINIVVDGNINVKGDGDPTTPDFVVDDGSRSGDSDRVDIFLEGNADFRNGFSIETGGENARNFWLYMNPGSVADLKSDTRFVGVIYGPGPGSGEGAMIRVKSSGEVFGALVGKIGGPKSAGVKSAEQIHYDQSLISTSVFDNPTINPPIRYLHISVNELKVSS